MRTLLLLAAAALLLPQVAQAQSTPAPTCQTLADVEKSLTAAKFPFVELDPRSLVGTSGVGLGKLLVVANGVAVVFGYEVDGCMSPPYPLAPVLKAVIGS